MGRVDNKAVWVFLPAMNDVFIRSETFEGFEAFGEVVSDHEQMKVFLKSLVVWVMVAFDGGFFDGTVHVLNLAVVGEDGVDFVR